MNTTDCTAKYCVVGAGASGLTAAKNLKQLGIPFDVIEREDEVGGNWCYGKPNSSIYRSVHMISSKRFSEYTDFPIPDHYPTYLGQAQAGEYLRSYARAFGLYGHIEFNRSVHGMTPVDGGRSWELTLDGGEVRRYRGVLIANGHLWKPRFPQYPGRFDGLSIHSGQYKIPDILRGKDVLVVGAGNSGCDIAVEASQNAARTFHSTRRGYYYWPKYLCGLPSDLVYEVPMQLKMPLAVRRFFGQWLLKLNAAGDAGKYGLPKPDHKLYDEHFIINSTLLYHLGHGDLTPKPDVQELRGDRVLFQDGSEEKIDVIVYATGFHLTEYPFIDKQHLNWSGEGPRMYLNIFHPQHDNLFMVGMFQTSTGNWPIMDYQAKLVSRYIHALEHAPRKAERLRRAKARPDADLSGGLRYYGSSRHALEVEHYTYRAKLKKLIAGLETGARPGSLLHYSAPPAAPSTTPSAPDEVFEPSEALK